MKHLILTALAIMFAVTLHAQDKAEVIDPSTMKTNLPIIVINTDNKINAQKKVAAKMTIISGKKGKDNRITDKSYDYDGNIKVKLRGNSSLSFNQKKYTLETCDANGKELDASLLGMPAEHDWVLLAPYNDVSMMRDPLAFKLWEEMGYWAPRCRMVEMVLNGQYRGVYILCEKIKQDANRVSIAKLKKEDNKGRELTGGYLLRIDTYKDDDATFRSKVPGIGEGLFNKQIVWTCLYPKKKNLTDEQFSYIQNYIDEVEQCFQSDNFADKDNGYSKYIKVSSFVDYFIHTELSLNADAYKRSAYFYKTKQNEDGTGGKLYAGPVWDYNLAYGNCNFCGANDIQAWAYNGCSTNPTPIFWKRLISDPAFKEKVCKRYTELRKTILSDKHIDELIDSYATLLADAQQRQYATYPELLASEGDAENMMGGMGGFPMMGMPMMGMPAAGDSIQGAQGMGGFPMMGMPMPGMMGMPAMPDSLQGQMPNIPGFPFFGNMPGFDPSNMPDFSNMPMPDFSNMPMPDFSNMPGFGNMGDFDPNNMSAAGNMMTFDFSEMPGMEGMQSMAVAMFAAYRVKSYAEEIKMLKDWMHERLTVMDEAFLIK